MEAGGAVSVAGGSFDDGVMSHRPKAERLLLVNRLTVPLESFP